MQGQCTLEGKVKVKETSLFCLRGKDKTWENSEHCFVTRQVTNLISDHLQTKQMTI